MAEKKIWKLLPTSVTAVYLEMVQIFNLPPLQKQSASPNRTATSVRSNLVLLCIRYEQTGEGSSQGADSSRVLVRYVVLLPLRSFIL